MTYYLFTAPYLPENKSDELNGLLTDSKLSYVTLFGRFRDVYGDEVKIPIYVVFDVDRTGDEVLQKCCDYCRAVGTKTIITKNAGETPCYYYIDSGKTETLPSYLNLDNSNYTKVCEVYFETVAFNADWIHKILEFKDITF